MMIPELEVLDQLVALLPHTTRVQHLETLDRLRTLPEAQYERLRRLLGAYYGEMERDNPPVSVTPPVTARVVSPPTQARAPVPTSMPVPASVPAPTREHFDDDVTQRARQLRGEGKTYIEVARILDQEMPRSDGRPFSTNSVHWLVNKQGTKGRMAPKAMTLEEKMARVLQLLSSGPMRPGELRRQIPIQDKAVFATVMRRLQTELKVRATGETSMKLYRLLPSQSSSSSSQLTT